MHCLLTTQVKSRPITIYLAAFTLCYLFVDCSFHFVFMCPTPHFSALCPQVLSEPSTSLLEHSFIFWLPCYCCFPLFCSSSPWITSFTLSAIDRIHSVMLLWWYNLSDVLITQQLIHWINDRPFIMDLCSFWVLVP